MAPALAGRRADVMRRADRLVQLVELPRSRPLSTAAWLARRMEVSVRTVYRDVADLQGRGVPIEGEAGVGYRFGSGYGLPPLMFDQDEARSLVAAARVARPWIDEALGRHLDTALGKILAVLPPGTRTAAESLPLYAPPYGLDEASRQNLARLRQATDERRWVRFEYMDEQSARSRRRVRPLGCFYWGRAWTLGAWCETRQDFRNFRIDRMQSLVLSDDRFPVEPGRLLPDLLRAVGAR